MSGVIDPADHLDLARLHLERLALAGDGTMMPVASTAQPAVRCAISFFIVRQRRRRATTCDKEAGAVGEIDEGNARRNRAGADPALTVTG